MRRFGTTTTPGLYSLPKKGDSWTNPEPVLANLLEERETGIKNQIRVATEILGHYEKVFTLSYSSTAHKILKHSLKSGANIVVAESRPLLEGGRLAECLPNVTIVTDSSIPDNS